MWVTVLISSSLDTLEYCRTADNDGNDRAPLKFVLETAKLAIKRRQAILFVDFS